MKSRARWVMGHVAFVVVVVVVVNNNNNNNNNNNEVEVIKCIYF
jgi:hypothetical protein